MGIFDNPPTRLLRSYQSSDVLADPSHPIVRRIAIFRQVVRPGHVRVAVGILNGLCSTQLQGIRWFGYAVDQRYDGSRSRGNDILAESRVFATPIVKWTSS
jgi:hypothetical protein